MAVRRRLGALARITSAVAASVPIPVVPAAAEPATTVAYPAGAAATRYNGLAFDTCTAPSVAPLGIVAADDLLLHLHRQSGDLLGPIVSEILEPQHQPA